MKNEKNLASKSLSHLFRFLSPISLREREREKEAKVMEGKRLPPLLNLSRLKATAAATGTGTTGIGAGAPATRGATTTTTTSGPSAATTLFDAGRELAADLQRREARRAQARAEASDTEGEASVLAALRAVHRLLRDAGEKKRERGN